MNIIEAACKNNGIGFKNTLPWVLRKEMNYFKKITQGEGNNAIVMGKNTWLSLNKALPKRTNYVISSTAINEYSQGFWSSNKLDNFTFVPNTEKIKDLLPYYDDVWIVGGEKLYKSLIDSSDVKGIYYTHIKEEFKCDTFFPEIPTNFSKIYTSQDIIENDIHYNIQIYKNKNYSGKFFIDEIIWDLF